MGDVDHDLDLTAPLTEADGWYPLPLWAGGGADADDGDDEEEDEDG